MNLVPHGILLQVTVWLINFQHGFRLCSGGEPGYLDFDNLPETNFSCVGKVIGGYYADVETGCQMFHVCTIGQKDEIMDIKFLCLNGTVFDQETRVCERVDEVDCSKSERFYNLNLELYGNNAVTLSLHEVPDDEGEPTESIDEQHSTTVRPTTSTTTTTTQRPTNPPATATTTVYRQQNTGYSQHYPNQPLYSTPQTSQSKSLYDDKNSGYHHQYIFHNGEQANNQATSFQLFSNQGVSSTTNQPQIHQARYGTTSSPQIILNSPSTVSPLFHGVSSTIQTLLNSNANNPSFINPLFHNHGTPSTTEHFTIHSNNPRETQEYHEDGEQSEERSRRPLEAVQSTNQGKISKLSISPVPESIDDEDSNESDEEPTSSSQSLKISTGFHPKPTTPEPTARSFYPTPRTSPKPDSGPTQITRHIHLSPISAVPQLKPQQITINLPPPDIQRIVQNPSPLLPSQSRVIVTAKASVSDESGRPLNASELVVLPLPTIPASYDDYKEGDESFDPFYRDVPKIRRSRSPPQERELIEDAEKVKALNRHRQALRRLKRAVLEDQSDYEDDEELARDYEYPVTDDSFEGEDARPLFSDSEEAMDIATIKANFKKFKALLLGRGISREISSERKTSKKHFSGVKSTSSYDGVEKPDDVAGEDGGSHHRKGKEMTLSEPNDAEDLIDDHEANGDGSSGDSNINDDVNSELMSMMKTFEVDEKEDVESVTVARALEADEQNDAEPAADIQKTVDQLDQIAVESDMKQSDQSESISGGETSVDKFVKKMEDSEKSMESFGHEKSEKTSNVDTPAVEETAKPKSAETTLESDAEEYIEPARMLNTKESDLEEYVDPESAPPTKEADVESVEPKINAKESDPKEYVRPESPTNTEKPEAHEDVEDSEKLVPVLNTQKPDDDEVENENADNENAPIPNDEAIAEINLETKPTGDVEEPTSEMEITTEATDGKGKLEPEAKINQPDQAVHQESINTSNDKEDSISEDSIKPEMTSDFGGLKEKKIIEPKAEKTDALTDVEEEEKAELSTKAQSSEAEENDQAETTDSEPEKDLESSTDVNAKDSNLEEEVEAQPERSEVISEVPQEAEKSVIPDDMKLHQVAVDQKPEVKEKLTDHAMGKKPDSLDEKVGSTAEKKDPTLEEKSEKVIKPEEMKDSKLSQLNPEKSNPISSGWRPKKARISTVNYPNLANRTPINVGASTERPSDSSKNVDTKTKSEVVNDPKLSESPSKNGVGDAEDVPKVLHTKSSENTTADEEYSNDAQLPETKEQNEEKHTEKENDHSADKSSESPNKVPSGALDCGDAVKQHEESSYEDSRGEYDDYTSEEYVSGSRESEPYERTSEEIGSQEATSEYTDSGYDSADEYSTSVEDYVPVSGEEYSTEDSRSTTSSEDYSTEGVLKFTDELPEPKIKHAKQKNRAATRAKVSSEDYVDDNYEPEHYRENSEEKNQSPEDSSNKKEQKIDHHSSGEEKLNDEAAEANSTTTTSTTTTTTTTTTARPTPPSLFRPFSVRKNYKFIPPSTTPNPVVIKHRFGLLNPRPAKPIKSYNDLAPRPVIRKSPLLSRKVYGTESTTKKAEVPQRRIDDFEDSSEIIWTSTEYTDEDEKPRENKLTRSANDVSFNETNESLGSDEDVSVIVEENLTKDSTTQDHNHTTPDINSDTETILSNAPAYLSTPYPLLKATTSGNLIKFENEKAVRDDEPTSETPKVTQIEGLSEISTISSSAIEGSTASSAADEKPLEADSRKEEEEEEEEEEGKETSGGSVSMVPFSCIDKEPYRFYGDPRDCRLFHYCSPGFTTKQMLDFRFVCENTTMFDEESQSCKYDLENSKCANRQW